MKLFFSILLSGILFAQTPKIIKSTSESITVEFTFSGMYQVRDTLVSGKVFQKITSENSLANKLGEPLLPQEIISLGIKKGEVLTYKILSDQKRTFKNKFLLPYTEQSNPKTKSEINFSERVYQVNQEFPNSPVSLYPTYDYRFATILPIGIYPFQFNPVTREIILHEKIVVEFSYQNKNDIFRNPPTIDKSTDDFLKETVLNYPISKSWTKGKISQESLVKTENEYWYNPQYTWFKLYVKNEGIYKITFGDIVNTKPTGIGNISIKKLKLFCEGEEIPIEVFDDGDSLFNNNDYFRFVGKAAQASPYCTLNIYNNSNVYWLTVNSSTDGKRYTEIDGNKDGWKNTFQQTQTTLHFEKDLLYERLGYAANLERDFWFWGKASGINSTQNIAFSAPFGRFENYLSDSTFINLRVNLHGLTAPNINPDHRAKILLTSQLVDSVQWDGQTAITFERVVDTKKIGIFSENNLQVTTDGSIVQNVTFPDQSGYDEILINWFEFDFWRENRANGNYYHFNSSPATFGKNRYSISNWTDSDMEIFIPQRGEVIQNPFFTLNALREVLFVDSTATRTDYYCTSLQNFSNVDSIKLDIPSDLRNTNQGVDYLIITYKNFKSAAERLKQYREINFPDSSITNPRIKIIDIEDIYDEFSYGLLDPYAVQSYIKYAFEKYSGTPITYVVLIGDMSYDYRELIATNRKNFIPSMPYHSLSYGLAASDNMFVAISGDDVTPDVAIGRLSCETLDEANILVDKIVAYPGDGGKVWKQNVLLVASGQDYDDEAFFRFNDASVLLENDYIKPNGFSTKKIFRYPNKSAYTQFKGDGPEIRKAIDSGAVIVNYYGHGGGYQWDLIFLNDDIYMLNNGGRLPFISSVTCYTAHFDNQNVFGEQFVKVPGKGAIGFWGSSGLTVYDAGVLLNTRFYDEVFNKNYKIVGKAITLAKNYANARTFADQVALATYFGDPVLEFALPKKPDYAVTEEQISIEPKFPTVGDQANVKILLNNFGNLGRNDSVVVELYLDTPTGRTLIDSKKIKSFILLDSVVFNWTPEKEGAGKLIVSINTLRTAIEGDFSDNEASKDVYVYKTSEPNIVAPINGYTTARNQVEFIIADIGEYVNKKLTYQIQIDTSLTFEKPMKNEMNLIPSKGYLKWTSPALDSGVYFSRIRSWYGIDSSNWTKTITFSITSAAADNISFSEHQLKLFDYENLFYSDSLKGITLHTSFLPAKPTNSRFIGKYNLTLPSDLKGISAMTTDGRYIYISSMYYYNNGQYAKIYKIGTGHESQEGQSYGEVSPVSFFIFHTMFYLDGEIYTSFGSPNSLLKVDVHTGDTTTVSIPGSFLNDNAQEKGGGFYLTSDGRYVYNLSVYDSLGAYKYRLRILDPFDNWRKVGEDKELSGTSYKYFTGFFVIDNYLYTYEYADANYMRRYDINSGRFEEEWITFVPYQGYFSWTYDKINNLIYAGVFRDGYTPRIAKYLGKYINSQGKVVTSAIGPAKKWNSVSYSIQKNVAAASANVQLEKYNSAVQQWESVKQNMPTPFPLDTLYLPANALLRLSITLKDTSTTISDAFNLSRIGWNFVEPVELSFPQKGLQFAVDTLLQGFPLEIQFSPENIGNTPSDTFQVACYFDDEKIPFYTAKTELKVDSSITLNSSFETSKIGGTHLIKVEIKPNESELFSFNNFLEKTFTVNYDTIRPTLQVLIDGKEILNGDIVSREPQFEISLKDNSPLPITKNGFAISIDDVPVDVAKIRDSIIPYPNNQTILKWKETSLKEGGHSLDVLAKDSSGNYFGTSTNRTSFYTYTENDVKYIYNYPNPFSTQTHFTFQICGEQKPEEILIKIYTIAGRLIKEIKPPNGDYAIGFNRVFWNGKDQDGDPIANGLYLYKLIAKFNNKTITTTQKLVKME